MHNDKTYTVYEHINKTNGKRYVGQTSEEDINNRWKCGDTRMNI